MDRYESKALKMFPGSVLVRQATEEELTSLGERGVTRATATLPIARLHRDALLLDSWADFLAPHFADGESVHFTGTYSDSYGYSHGLMLSRNVLKDFTAFRHVLAHYGFPTSPWCVGVEYHPSGRSILHLHALLGGSWDASQRRQLEQLWGVYRGHARATAVKTREDCVKYAAKHLLKQGAQDCFDFGTDPPPYIRDRHGRRVARGAES